MTWEEIIKLRQGPQKELDAKIQESRTSPDRETRRLGSEMESRSLMPLLREIQMISSSISQEFVTNRYKIIHDDGPLKGKESFRAYKLLSKLMEKIADLYIQMYGDVDRVDADGRNISTGQVTQSDEFMRNTAANFRETAQALRKR
jgi:hypothetical protein